MRPSSGIVWRWLIQHCDGACDVHDNPHSEGLGRQLPCLAAGAVSMTLRRRNESLEYCGSIVPHHFVVLRGNLTDLVCLMRFAD